MNRIKNDRGEVVISVGAPGSVVRATAEWPGLIERLNALHNSFAERPELSVDQALEMICMNNVRSRMGILSILKASIYGKYFLLPNRNEEEVLID